jgi:hypothetical protein
MRMNVVPELLLVIRPSTYHAEGEGNEIDDDYENGLEEHAIFLY